MAACATCGGKLGLSERILGHQVCSSCQAKEEAARQAALAQYLARIDQLGEPNADVRLLTSGLKDLEAATGLGAAGAEHRTQAVTAALRATLADGVFTEAEDDRIDQLAKALGIDLMATIHNDATLRSEVAIGIIADGRLEDFMEGREPTIMLKPNERDYLEVDAELLKEVVDRQTVGGYSGVSFRVAKGVRFNTGGIRSHSVVTGTHTEVADRGTLAVTSKRLVFTGARAGIEVPYVRLLSINAYRDGVGLVIANRAKIPVIRVSDGAMVAAMIHAAVGRG